MCSPFEHFGKLPNDVIIQVSEFDGRMLIRNCRPITKVRNGRPMYQIGPYYRDPALFAKYAHIRNCKNHSSFALTRNGDFVWRDKCTTCKYHECPHDFHDIINGRIYLRVTLPPLPN